MSRIGYLERYLAASADLLGKLPVAAIDGVIRALVQTMESGRFIYVMGNGGSAANAEHLVNDLGKGGERGFPRRFKILSLTGNVPLMTAWANDTDYDQVFAEQLRNFVGRGDLVMAISGSGNSRNVLNAVTLGPVERSRSGSPEATAASSSRSATTAWSSPATTCSTSRSCTWCCCTRSTRRSATATCRRRADAEGRLPTSARRPGEGREVAVVAAGRVVPVDRKSVV